MKHKSRRKWLCVDCSEHTSYEHYFVHNSVWMGEAGMGETGMLCIGCLEKRIGRILVPGDFSGAHINDPRTHPMSDRLRSRIKGTALVS